jgi:hypothetical protein
LTIPHFRGGGSGSVVFTVAVAVSKPNISFFFGFTKTLALAEEK